MSPTTAVATLALVLQAAAPAPPPGAPGAARPLAVADARIHPVSGPVIPDGVLLVRDGRIAAVGADVDVPADAQVVDAAGRSLIPGIVESHSHMGFKQLWRPATGSNNNELSEPINARLRAIDGLNSRDPAFAIALAGGVTTMNITTGSRSPNSGQAAVVKLRGGTVDDMFLAHGGMKFAIRATTNRPGFPDSIREVHTLLRDELRAAEAYLERRGGSGADGGVAAPERDLTLEALGRLLTGEWPVGVHAHGADAMRIAIALQREFDLDLYIHHANATGELAEDLLEAGIPVSYGPVLPFRGREDDELAGVVRYAGMGGSVSFHQDHPDGPQYYLRPSASMFVRQGMSRSEALEALTLNPARLFRVDDRIGSLEPGKDADFVLLDGPPLEFESRVDRVFVDGREVYRRGHGYNVFEDGTLPEGGGR